MYDRTSLAATFAALLGACTPGAGEVDHLDDRALVRALLARDFAGLSAQLEQVQGEFAAGQRSEVSVDLAFDALANNDPAHDALLTAWVKAQPDAYAPLLARGRYYLQLGLAWRVEGYARDVSVQQREQLRNAFDLAERDITAALALKPGLTVAYASLVQLSGTLGDDTALAEWTQRGLAVAPASYEIRKSRLYLLFPRWGGSYAEIDAFVEDTKTHVDENPALRGLLGFADYVRAFNLHRAGHCEEAIATLDQALAAGETAWLWKERGICQWRLGKFAAAVADLNRAVALYPQMARALYWRGSAYLSLGDADRAFEDFAMAVELDPFDYYANKDLGYEQSKRGLDAEAAASYRRALTYRTDKADTWYQLGWTQLYRLKDAKAAAQASGHATRLASHRPRYQYLHARALYETRDCGLVAAFDRYLKLCSEGGDHAHECRGDERQWASEVRRNIIDAGYCPD